MANKVVFSEDYDPADQDQFYYKTPLAEEIYGEEQKRLLVLQELSRHASKDIRSLPHTADNYKFSVTPIYRATDPIAALRAQG